MEFEWDPSKALVNARKHGVDFAEALTVFGDPLEMTVSDPDHSVGERRFLSMGLSESGRLLVVGYTERAGRIRIVGARAASTTERKHYESRHPGKA